MRSARCSSKVNSAARAAWNWTRMPSSWVTKVSRDDASAAAWTASSDAPSTAMTLCSGHTSSSAETKNTPLPP